MITTDFNPFPNLETEHLHLRELTMNDAPDFFLMRSDLRVMKYIGRPIAKTVEDAEKIIQVMLDNKNLGDGINWGICMKNTSKVIGNIGYYRMKKEHDRAEVGYLLSADLFRKGIMHEALNAVLDYGFAKMNLHSVEAVINPANEASEKLLLKNNFVREGYFKEEFFWNGVYQDSAVFSLLKKNRKI